MVESPGFLGTSLLGPENAVTGSDLGEEEASMAVHELAATVETTRVGVTDRENLPVITIDSGDEVITKTLALWADSVTPDSTLEDIMRLRTEVYSKVGPHTLTGPIAVRGAMPGKVLRLDILELVPRPNGINLQYPGSFGTGLLPEDFPDGRLTHFDLDLKNMVTRAFGCNLPLKPFLGTMGVAPRDPGPHSTVPPGPHGGNMDVTSAGVGSTIYFPIWKEGADLSIGDGHALMGSGEVCLTAVECAMERVRLRLTVQDGPELERPRIETPTHWITLGFDEDLLLAAKQAVRDMIRLLTEKTNMSASEAYGLCSIAVDLSVTQVVNKVRGVHANLSKSLFAAS
jgi:acetamidase/formamidase